MSLGKPADGKESDRTPSLCRIADDLNNSLKGTATRHNVSFGMHTLHLWVAVYPCTIGLLTFFLLPSPAVGREAYFLPVGHSLTVDMQDDLVIVLRTLRIEVGYWSSSAETPCFQDFILLAESYHAFGFSCFRVNIVGYRVVVLFLHCRRFYVPT